MAAAEREVIVSVGGAAEGLGLCRRSDGALETETVVSQRASVGGRLVRGGGGLRGRWRVQAGLGGGMAAATTTAERRIIIAT